MDYDAYLSALLAPLLKSPEKASVYQSKDELGILLTVTVAKEDMGVVIGKEGATAKALRHIISIAGIRRDTKVAMKITEPDGTPYKPFDRAGIVAQ